jgi:hypothetical protein
MPRNLLATIVAAAFITSGCTGPSEPTEADVQPPATTEEAGPSVEEFASIIAEGRRDVDEWLETWDENYCSPMGVTDETDIMACEISLISGGLIAETKLLELSSATQEDSLVYIGQPPDSIAIIWQSTEDAAAAASQAGEAIPEDCPASEDCTSKVMDFVSAMEDLQGKYDSWAPYM